MSQHRHRSGREPYEPTDKDIRALAYKRWEYRETKGIAGDALADWLIAKRSLEHFGPRATWIEE